MTSGLEQAIDDDIIENFIYPRMNSADGGAWSGMQAVIQWTSICIGEGPIRPLTVLR